MPFCRYCGSREPQDAAFCGSCGRALTPTSVTVASEDASVQSTSVPTLAQSATLPAAADQPGPGAESVGETTDANEERRSGYFTPPLPVPPLPDVSSGQPPGVQYTPQPAHLPAVQGTPQMPGANAAGNVAGSLPAGNLSGPSASLQQPGGYPGHSSASHLAAEPHQEPRQPHEPGQHYHQPEPPRKHPPRRWHPNRYAASHGASSAGTVGAAGGATASAAGMGLVLKVALIVVIAAGAAVGAVKAAPYVFHTATTPVVQTQPMPVTQTSCPAPGTARAMVSRPLAQGDDQNIVFVNYTGTSATVERYDVTTRRTKQIFSSNQAINDAQVSPDGKWIFFTTNTGAQTALQVIRMDGQGLQTLYCNANLASPLLSPDLQWLALDTSTSAVSNALTLTMIQTSSGALYTQNLQPQDQFTYYSPFAWVDATHLYLSSRYDYLHRTIYQMYDLSVAHPQQMTLTPVPGLQEIDDWLEASFALSTDNKTLFTNTYYFGQGITTGPGTILEQSVAGSSPRTIYRNPNGAIVESQQVGSALLFVIDNNTGGAPGSTIDTSQNGLWKINMDGTGLVRLASSDASSAFWLTGTSRNGGFYAYELEQGIPTVGTTLYYASLNAGSATAFTTETYTNDSASISIVGWTTM